MMSRHAVRLPSLQLRGVPLRRSSSIVAGLLPGLIQGLGRSALLAAVLVSAAAQAAESQLRRVVFGSYADPVVAEEKAREVRAALGIEVQMVLVDQDGSMLTRVTSMPLAGDEVWPLTSKAANARLEYWTWRLPE